MTIKLNEIPTEEQIEQAADERIDRRRETGKSLMKIAHELQDAQREVDRLTKEYEKAYKTATTDAWSPQELAATGLPSPASATRQRRRRTKSGTNEKFPLV